MIGRLRGKLLAQEPDLVLLETAAGVGYEVRVAPRTLVGLPPVGSELTLHVHTQVREDAITLYGFLDEQDRSVFRTVQGVTGIGPKLAMAIVGTVEPTALVAAIAREDIPGLSKIPGLGKKTAARLCLELKDKLARLLEGAPPGEASELLLSAGQEPVAAAADVRDALAALGYNAREITRAIKAAEPEPNDSVQSLLRRALKTLSPA
ncbi:MAG: Holliday junction branch migration protein RuvA [Rickettsiales bacterium]|nr:Holliday junction branch migration protein RuvA [Rickettsiales bacterium]|tara:strand:- start:294 stop:914 length:621 start_codon:yes stop_codon:yes gene_type:complete